MRTIKNYLVFIFASLAGASTICQGQVLNERLPREALRPEGGREMPVDSLQIQLPPQPGKKYYIKTALTNRYLDVYTANPAPGTPLQIWNKVGGPNQVWEIFPSPEPGYYYIKSEMGRYLDVRRGSTTAGTPTHIWDFNGGNAQKWQIDPAEGRRGYFTIRSKVGNFLDVKSAATSNGTSVWMWSNNPGPAQHWKFEEAGKGNPLSGIVDMHTHPMSHLGFGRKAMHGVPDIGSIIPAGTRNCNAAEFRARSIEEALGHCNSTHGGWGVDNTCGDYIRAGIINLGVDDSFIHKSDNPHGDHHHAGFPDFKFWPHQTSKLHQQMWWEWLKRAYEGGLRVIVALTVNSEILAEILNGDPPYDDKTVADTQINETIRFVNNHSDFMQIAYSAADVREIVRKNKLAVILGMEVDKFGNFGKPGVPTSEAAVRSELRRLYDKGVRYIFPVHLIDNSFSGAAVYDMLFNFANKQANGYHFRVETSPDPHVDYGANLTSGPLGFENALILDLKGHLTAIGEIPAPCFNNVSCSPPPGKVRCCGSYDRIVNVLTPTPELDVYKTIPRGHVNILGLTRLGEVAIKEMMKLGMIIDVDHMSERAMTRSIEIAEGVAPNGYPLVMGHNGLRKDGGRERDAPPALVIRISELGGMFGLGTGNITPKNFIANYRNVWETMGGRAVAIGTDVNGFELLPTHTRPRDPAASRAFYSQFFRESGIREKQKTGNRVWDYVTDGGVSHYGLMPEFLFDVKISRGGEEVVRNLMSSVEYFAEMWENAERNKLNVR